MKSLTFSSIVNADSRGVPFATAGHMEDKGFSLVEVLIAIAIVVAGAASVAQLFVFSAESIRSAQASSAGLVLAQEKIEALRAESALDSSPAGTLDSDTTPFVDYLGSDGASITVGAATPPVGTVYIRRWSIDELPGSARPAWLVQVVVIPWSGSAAGASASARLFTVTTRKAA